MNPIIPAIVTLNALRDGHVMNELTDALHEATMAVEAHGKPATVTLTITIKQIGTQGVSDAMEVIGEVGSKLPKPALPTTLFFVNGDGNLSRTREKQEQLPGIAGVVRSSAAA